MLLLLTPHLPLNSQVVEPTLSSLCLYPRFCATHTSFCYQHAASHSAQLLLFAPPPFLGVGGRLPRLSTIRVQPPCAALTPIFGPRGRLCKAVALSAPRGLTRYMTTTFCDKTLSFLTPSQTGFALLTDRSTPFSLSSYAQLTSHCPLPRQPS